MPRGFWAFASAGLLEAGVAGLVLGFLAGGRGLVLAGTLAVGGTLSFLSRVVFMLRHRRPAPTELRRPDWSVAHALQSLVYLLAAGGLGLYLAWAEPSDDTLALASAYGVFGLVGFLAQIVVGVEGRVLPLFAWLWGFADREYQDQPPSLHGATVRGLQAMIFGLWTAGVPLLALGLARDKPSAVSMGAGLLLLALLLGLVNATGDRCAEPALAPLRARVETRRPRTPPSGSSLGPAPMVWSRP
jgi:hypothetical protein